MSERASLRASTTKRSLARAIGRRCSGRTLILGRAFPELMARLESQGNEVSVRRLGAPEDLPATGTAAEGSFDTIALVDAIEYVDAVETPALLRRIWSLLEPRGKLLVCVPNQDHLGGADVRQRFTRRGLKELLKTIDQPKVFTDQPFRWLFMGLDSDPRVDRATDERHRVIAELCRGRVLELGCGAGHLCKRIAERGLAVSGVDKNAAKIEKARRLFPDIPFDQADILGLSVERRSDTVVLAEVLEHVTEEVGARMLSRAWELVAPRGRLVVSVPNEDLVRHANHLREFSERDLADLLAPFGEPRAVVDQPFRWLLAHVDREG